MSDDRSVDDMTPDERAAEADRVARRLLDVRVTDPDELSRLNARLTELEGSE